MNPSLYIHIPFCHRKCFYCSFVVSIGQGNKTDLYLDCLAGEAKLYKGTSISTIYLGGGTPTFLNCDQLKRLAKIIKENFKYERGTEWTIEANPEGIDADKLKVLKELGINRISLGIQSLNDKYLKYLGRNHTSGLAVRTFKALRGSGFDNVNVDFMYSFPDQTQEDLEEDLRAMIKLESEHISVYMLTIEEPSRFYSQKIKLKDNEIQAQEYTMAGELLEEANLGQYEISNFAKKTRESKHNLNYWRGGDYVGLGVGAHSHLQGKRFWNTRKLEDYIKCVQAGHPAFEGEEELPAYEQLKERLLFGLRLNEGINLKRLREDFHLDLKEIDLEKIDSFIEQNFLIRDRDYLKASKKGRLVLDELCARLI